MIILDLFWTLEVSHILGLLCHYQMTLNQKSVLVEPAHMPVWSIYYNLSQNYTTRHSRNADYESCFPCSEHFEVRDKKVKYFPRSKSLKDAIRSSFAMRCCYQPRLNSTKSSCVELQDQIWRILIKSCEIKFSNYSLKFSTRG